MHAASVLEPLLNAHQHLRRQPVVHRIDGATDRGRETRIARRLDAGEPPTSTCTLSRSLTSRFSRVRPSRLRRAPAQATMHLRAKE